MGLLSSGRKFAGSCFGVWPRRCTLIAAMAALLLLPIEASDAGWLSDVFKSSPKQGKSPKQVTSPKPAISARPAASPRRHTEKPAAERPAALNPSASKPVATMCDPKKFRIVLDVGHTAQSER